MNSFDEQFAGARKVSPQPLPIRPALPAAGDYPLDALSPKLLAAARAIIDKVQVPAAVAASSVLATASLAVQAYVDVAMPTGEIVPTSLFMVTVATSGDRKSSTDKLALRAVREREKELRYDYAQEQAGFTNARAAYDASRKKAQSGAKSRSDIERALENCGREPIAPALPMLTVDEPTMPALQKLFAEAMPSLGLFSDEGATLIGGHAMSEDNRVQTGGTLSKLWDGAPIKRVRASEVTTFLPGRRLALHLMVQPGVARRLFGDAGLKDQGLLSRLLICQPTSMKGERMWRNPDADSDLDLEKYGARIVVLLRGEMPMNPETRELTPAVLRLSPEAQEIFVDWHNAVEVELRKGGAFEEISGFAGKLPEHSLRIAAVMAFFEDRHTVMISRGALAAGIKIAQFHAAESLRLFNAGGTEDEDTTNAALIIAWIRGQQLLRVGVRLLSRHGPGRGMNGTALKRAVGVMVDLGHLIQIAGGADVTFGEKTEFRREAYTVIAEDDQ